MFYLTYFALFVGELSFTVAFFLYDVEEYAATYSPQAPSIDIRPYEVARTDAHTDDRLPPNVFIGAEELPRH